MARKDSNLRTGDYESPDLFVYAPQRLRIPNTFPVALSAVCLDRPYAEPGGEQFRTGCGYVEEVGGVMETEHRTTAEPNSRSRNWWYFGVRGGVCGGAVLAGSWGLAVPGTAERVTLWATGEHPCPFRPRELI